MPDNSFKPMPLRGAASFGRYDNSYLKEGNQGRPQLSIIVREMLAESTESLYVIRVSGGVGEVES